MMTGVMFWLIIISKNRINKIQHSVNLPMIHAGYNSLFTVKKSH